MSMSRISSIRGTIISTKVTEYGEFKTDDGSTVPAGINHYVWLIEADQDDPVKIKLSGKDQAATMKANIGKETEMVIMITSAEGTRELALRVHNA